MRMIPPWMVVLLLAACGSQQAFEVRAKAWPAADQLFRSEPRWLGGDAAFSVDLGNERTLWLFGDSFIATSAALKRTESTMVRNSVAIQQGNNPATAKMTFHWRQQADKPASFVPQEGEAWYWPSHGVRLGSSLLLFFARVVKNPDPKSLGFQADGWEARRVGAPDESPTKWTLSKVAVPKTRFALVGSVALVVDANYLLAYSVREPDSHDLVLHRWDKRRAADGDLSAPQWWMGKARGWIAHRDLGHDEPAVLFRGSTEFSVHHDAERRRYLYVQTEGFGAADLVLRTATSPEGPWSAARKVCRPPESDRGGKVIVYAGKAHPQLGGKGLVATYASNSLDFGELVRDTTLYYPRFVLFFFSP